MHSVFFMENQKDELPYSSLLRCDYASRWAENIRIHLRQSSRCRKTESSQEIVYEMRPEKNDSRLGNNSEDNESQLQNPAAPTLDTISLGSENQPKIQEGMTETLTEKVGQERDIPYSCTIYHCKSKWKRCLKDHEAVDTMHKPFSCPLDGCDYRTKWPQSVISYSKGHHNTNLRLKMSNKTKKDWRSKMDCQKNTELNMDRSTYSFACMLCEFVGESELSALKHARQHRPVVITLE